MSGFFHPKGNWKIGVSDVVTSTELFLGQWFYWWWLWFILFNIFAVSIAIFVFIIRIEIFNPIINSSLVSEGKMGDFFIALIPVIWCFLILISSNTLLEASELQFETAVLTLRIQGKQWYWVYKFDSLLNNAFDSIGTNVGHNNIYSSGSRDEFVSDTLSKSKEIWSELFLKSYFFKLFDDGCEFFRTLGDVQFSAVTNFFLKKFYKCLSFNFTLNVLSRFDGTYNNILDSTVNNFLFIKHITNKAFFDFLSGVSYLDYDKLSKHFMFSIHIVDVNGAIIDKEISWPGLWCLKQKKYKQSESVKLIRHSYSVASSDIPENAGDVFLSDTNYIYSGVYSALVNNYNKVPDYQLGYKQYYWINLESLRYVIIDYLVRIKLLEKENLERRVAVGASYLNDFIEFYNSDSLILIYLFDKFTDFFTSVYYLDFLNFETNSFLYYFELGEVGEWICKIFMLFFAGWYLNTFSGVFFTAKFCQHLLAVFFMIVYSSEFSVNCFEWSDIKQTVSYVGSALLWGVINFGLFQAQRVWFDSDHVPGVAVVYYRDFITYNKGELPIIFLEKYNAIIFNYKAVKEHDNPNADQKLTYLSDKKGLILNVGDKFFEIKFKNIDSTANKYFIVRNAVTIKGYVALNLSYSVREEDFTLAFGTLVEDEKSGRIKCVRKADTTMVDFLGEVVTTKTDLKRHRAQMLNKNKTSYVNLVKPSNMLSNISSDIAEIGQLIRWLERTESVHLLEKAPNLLESKLDISIVSCVIAHLYTKVNNVLLDLTGRFLAIKLLNLQKMQLYSYEELNYVIKLIEVTLFVLGVFLIVYWSSPRLRFYIALIFVCSLLSGVECFDWSFLGISDEAVKMGIISTAVLQLAIFTVDRVINYISVSKVAFWGTNLYLRCLFNYEWMIFGDIAYVYNREVFFAHTWDGSHFLFPDPDKVNFFFVGRYFYLANAYHNFLVGLRSNGNAFCVDIAYCESVEVCLSDLIDFEDLGLDQDKKLLDRVLISGPADKAFKAYDYRYDGVDEDEMSVDDNEVSYDYSTLNEITWEDFTYFDLKYNLQFEKKQAEYRKLHPNLTDHALLYLMFLEKYFGSYLGYYRGKLNSSFRSKKNDADDIG